MKTLEKLAREAGGVMMFPGNGDEPPEFNMTTEDLARFRSLCRAEAMEEAAQIAERVCSKEPNPYGGRLQAIMDEIEFDATLKCAAAIREQIK